MSMFLPGKEQRLLRASLVLVSFRALVLTCRFSRRKLVKLREAETDWVFDANLIEMWICFT
jgi:hypothetical protein